MVQDKILIAGGGIGGLAAALALARKGFRSVVLEQAPQFGEIGAGIQLAPNAWHALDASASARWCEAGGVHRAAADDGRGERREDDRHPARRSASRSASAIPMRSHRADIHGSLLDGCKALPELIELRTSTASRALTRTASGVRRG